MKKLLSSCALVALLASSPALADAHKTPMMEVAQTWTGFFVSGSAGAGAIVHELSVPGLGSFNGIGGEGMFASLGLGYDRQFHSNYVAGVFVDFDISGVSTELSGGGFTATVDQTRALNIGARLGYLTSPSTLWYGLIGWSRTKLELEATGLGSFDLGTYSGLMLGGGVESQLGRGWSVKAEYRYVDYGDKSIAGFVDLAPSTHTGRVGISYKFNRGDDHAPHHPVK